MKTRSIVVLLLGFATIALGGLQNARLVHHSGLAATMQAVRAEDAWIVYQVPTPASRYVMCCMDWLGHGKVVATKTCHLGSSASSFNGTDHIANIDTSSMIVALHEENGAVRDVEVYSGGCPVDADGKTVHVVDNVSVDESLGVLDGIVGRADHRRGRDGALNAIALHETPRAVQILERIATGNGDTKLRGQAVFWIAQTGGRHGFDVARRLANDDSDHDVRRHAVFALTQSSDAG
ncbi:MAG TPA: hypothetical protein VG323_01425, partial [Thermoanaerobaculia bacterium]|nr:hypothetical protein [Thermoanaerobaculia bacterium]